MAGLVVLDLAVLGCTAGREVVVDLLFAVEGRVVAPDSMVVEDIEPEVEIVKVHPSAADPHQIAFDQGRIFEGRSNLKSGFDGSHLSRVHCTVQLPTSLLALDCQIRGVADFPCSLAMTLSEHDP